MHSRGLNKISVFAKFLYKHILQFPYDYRVTYVQYVFVHTWHQYNGIEPMSVILNIPCSQNVSHHHPWLFSPSSKSTIMPFNCSIKENYTFLKENIYWNTSLGEQNDASNDNIVSLIVLRLTNALEMQIPS